jgi:arylsulfatase A-like enzyme
MAFQFHPLLHRPHGGFVSASSLLCLALLLPARAADRRPNILFLLSDDHSVPHLGCYGSPNAITPNLDAFAAEGMRFTRAYTTAPQCAPSRASFFFGRSPVGLGVTRFTQPAPGDSIAFTDVLRRHGYWVGLDGRFHHLGGKNKEEPHVEEALREAGLDYIDRRFDYVRVVSLKSEENLTAIPAFFGETLEKIPRGKPFFLYFGFKQPHRPWKANPDLTKFDPAKLKLPPDFPDLPAVRADYAQFLSALFDLDRGFGLLMKELQERGLADNTLVVFMADNGESLLRGKGTLYDRGTHVPLIVRWPGVVAAGARSDILVSGEDLAATVLEAVGLAVPGAMTSVSFLRALQGEASGGRKYIFAERSWHGSGPVTRTDGLDLSRSITSKSHRLIYNVLPDRAYTPVDMFKADAWRALTEAHAAKLLSPLHERLLFAAPRPIFELFDLERDPFELTNLAGQPATEAIETALCNELARWMVRESDFLPLPSRKRKE